MERKLLPLLAILAIVLVSGCAGEPQQEWTPAITQPVTANETVSKGGFSVKLADIEVTKLYPPTFLKEGFILGIEVTNEGQEDAEFPYEAALIDRQGTAYKEAVYNRAISGKVFAGETLGGNIRIWDVPANLTGLTLRITLEDQVWEFEVR